MQPKYMIISVVLQVSAHVLVITILYWSILYNWSKITNVEDYTVCKNILDIWHALYSFVALSQYQLYNTSEFIIHLTF